MLSYLRREWQSYGENATNVKEEEDTRNDEKKSKIEKPIKTENRYCYKSPQKIDKYESDLQGFSLGTQDEHINPTTLQIYDGVLTNGHTFINTDPPCSTIFELNIKAENGAMVDGKPLTDFSCFVTSITKDENEVCDITYHCQSDLDDAQKRILLRGFSSKGCSGLNDVKINSILRMVDKALGSEFHTRTQASLYTWDRDCAESYGNKVRVGERKVGNSRIIIYQQEDGFWKILTETTWIDLRAVFKPYGIMGGAFKNWLVDSGFDKYEHQYSYEREGKMVSATTITYPKPTGKAGVNQPWRPATDYNGQYVCLQPGDTFSVWYFEDQWQIRNAIYAKNFQSDTMAEGVLENKGQLIFKMNYIPSLANIKNKPGKVQYRYINGGFAQVDASSYTGMALIFNFECIGKKFYTEDYKTKIDNSITPYICFIGKNYTPDGYFYEKGCCSGFAAGYDTKTISHKMTISYTVMRPSDPDFITGGDVYGQSITSSLEVSIRDLQDQINSIRAELNISQVTSAVFSAITSLGDLPNLFSNITQIYSKLKDVLSKLKTRKSKSKPIRATMIVDKNTVDVPNVSIINRMSEELEVGIIYNSIRKTEKHDIPKFALSTELELPYIQTTSTLTPKFTKYLKERGLLTVDDIAVQFDPLDATFSTLRKKNAEIMKYKIDPEIAHEVLSQMSNSATRSLFSLNVRKQISTHNEFSTPTYEQLIGRILNDKEILDVLGKLNPHSVGNMFQEFVDRMQDMLSYY
uniref:Outer capsid protein VP4 n=1 Tax=Rotavirus B TaxID=28876 RepID=A0A2H4ZSX3_9REOV|nr:outer capsid spike protein [Rotavirus B]